MKGIALFSHKLFLPVFCLLLLFTACAAMAAESRTPLLQEGKKTLFQRVISHPGTKLYAGAETGSAVTQDEVKPFSIFYVYDRKNGRLEVGPSSTAPSGWMESSAATDWPQAMTLIFTPRGGRMPVLFFKEQKDIVSICKADDMKEQLKSLEKTMAEAKTGQPDASVPVLAAEPSDEQGAVSRNRFYIMPIQSMSDPFEGTKFLQVASIDPGSAQGKPVGGAGSGDGAQKNGGKPENMRTAIVFVIDTTVSMKPYIEQSLNVIRSAFDNIEKEKLGDSVGFAVVAFRNNTEHNAKIGYVTKVISDFKTLSERKLLEDALAKVDEATASTHSYDEDSMAGVKAAVDDLSWGDFQSRVMVLITDAGPLPPGDALASTRMAPSEMMDYARTKNIWLTVCHVRSPSGAKNHAYAEKAYRELTSTGSGSSYIPIPAPTPKAGAESFARTAKVLAESLTKVVKTTAERKLPQKPEPKTPDRAAPEEQAKAIGDRIGYAMQLEFLGSQRGNRAPSVVSAWIADMDLDRLADGEYIPTVEVAVLLTKNQLSDLQKQLKVIIDQAERTKKTDSKDFFEGILSASAQMARDPNAFSIKPGQNLQETGVLGEFLEGLPYKSDIMLLREEDWYRMSVGQQAAFINKLRSRIARYEEYDKDRDNWESFGAPDAGDWVYRVPLSMLP